MALIVCPECGKEISDKARICINCGYPLSEIKVEEQIIQENTNIEYDSTENLHIDFNKRFYIDIENGYLSVYIPLYGETRDLIENFVLDYYAVSMGLNIGLSIYNLNKNFYSNVMDVVATKENRQQFDRFKEIMDKHGRFSNRSRFDALYKRPKEVKVILEENMIKVRRELRGLDDKKCPYCGSKRYHAFVEDKVIRQGKTKMQTSVNLNPLKPFTLFNTKEKVVRNPLTMQVSKFVCDDCGKIFQ